MGLHNQMVELLPEREFDPRREAKSRLEHLRAAVADIRKIDKGKKLDRVRTYRNKRIAHPIYRTREEQKTRGAVIDSLVLQDVNDVLFSAFEPTRAIERALSGDWIDYDDLLTVAINLASEFYGRVQVRDLDASPAPPIPSRTERAID
jgi:hypothetical protein